MKPANALKERKQMNSNTTLLVITIVLFFVLYAAGCVAYAGKGFTTVQTFLNVLRSNAGLICVACGMTCVMLTGGIDISVGSLIAMDCMIIAYGLNNWGWASAPTIILLVLAIGAGSVFFSHLNDAGFWLVKEYFGMTVGQTLKTWSLMETILSVVGLGCVMLLSLVL